MAATLSFQTPTDIQITIEMDSRVSVPGEEAEIHIPSLKTFEGRPLARFSFAPGDKSQLTARIPSGPQNVDIAVFFRRLKEEVRVSAALIADQLQAIKFVQDRYDYVSVNMIHAHSYVEDQQCTVNCPKTGESRSGMGACVSCPGPKGTVRICC